ncbi:MAG TPA: hypothetical protein ENF99_00950 [Candidatus Aenigmarchaeota archaeon]|nr:hypothetical protein [Candidatus Aenigmarchaeota archaeon]
MNGKCFVCQRVEGDTICIECLKDPVKRELFHLITWLKALNYNIGKEESERIVKMYWKKVKQRIKKGMKEKEILKEIRKIKREIRKEL